MKAFTIDSENDITVFASLKETKEAGVSGRETNAFCSQEELGALAENWPGARLVEIWNGLPGVKPVQKFTTRAVAVRRIWAAIQQLQPVSGTPSRALRSKSGRRKTTGTNVPRAVLPQNKASLVIALLQSPNGATLQGLMRATGWQAHTVRGFVSGHLKKKLGLKVRSFRRDGERVYAIKG